MREPNNSRQRGFALTGLVLSIAVLFTTVSATYLFSKLKGNQIWAANHAKKIQTIVYASKVYYESTCQTGELSLSNLQSVVPDISITNGRGSTIKVTVDASSTPTLIKLDTSYQKRKYASLIKQKLKNVSTIITGNDVEFVSEVGVSSDLELTNLRQQQRLLGNRVCS